MMKIVVGFSGGADSQAVALLARQHCAAEDVILLNADPGGNEHPITKQFIAEYSRTVFPVITVHPIVADLHGIGTRNGKSRDERSKFNEQDALTFPMLAKVKGRWPARKSQFCTDILKLRPSNRWLSENLRSKGIEFERWIGIRHDESAARRNRPIYEYDDIFECFLRCPIAEWTKNDVFVFLESNGEEVNPLYKLGFSRVGCAPCVNSGKDDVREWAARFPEMIDKVREWEAYTQRTFFAPCVPGREINWIDEVVEWSRTGHGGRQPLLAFVEMEAASGGCSSKYGLCE